MDKKQIAWLLLAAILLAACSRPSSPILATTASPGASTSSADDLATQVSQLLTKMPEETSAATTEPQIATETPGGQTTELASPLPPAATNPPEVLIPTPTDTLAPTDTLIPTSTATIVLTPSDTPVPTATFPSTDPRSKLGPPTWQDNFKDTTNWPTGEDKFTRVELKENNLVLTALTNFDGWRLTYPQIQKTYLEMSAKMPACAGIDHYGLIFRVPNLALPDQGYLFGITCDGQYSLRKWNNPTMTSLVFWKKNTNIVQGPGKVNRIGVKTSGNTISLYVNGVLLGDVADASYPDAGYFGIFVGSNKTTNPAVWVSQISYWNLP